MATGTMSSRHSWWMLAIRGIIALLFGLAVFIRPNMFGTFALLFGIYALVDGIIAVGTSVDERTGNSRWWITLLEGVVGIVFGILAIVLAKSSLLYVIAIWALIMGILEIASGFIMHRTFAHEWTMVVGGVVSAVLGILFFIFATKGVMALLPLVGIFAIVFGVMMFARSVQFKTAADMGSSVATA
jgi:uncharacterized membrane protein HdeD (DUF308 family)